jgi:hypothetical protein
MLVFHKCLAAISDYHELLFIYKKKNEQLFGPKTAENRHFLRDIQASAGIWAKTAIFRHFSQIPIPIPVPVPQGLVVFTTAAIPDNPR